MMDYLAIWLPFIVVFVVFLALGRAAQRTQKKQIDEVNAVNRAIVDTNRDMIAKLREIKQILKDQN